MNHRNEFNFENLEVYKKALALTTRLFEETSFFPRRIQYSLVDQLRRAVLSIVNNIAEGSDNESAVDKRRYYSHAYNSARECIPMLTVGENCLYIKPSKCGDFRHEVIDISKMLKGLIHSTLNIKH